MVQQLAKPIQSWPPANDLAEVLSEAIFSTVFTDHQKTCVTTEPPSAKIASLRAPFLFLMDCAKSWS